MPNNTDNQGGQIVDRPSLGVPPPPAGGLYALPFTAPREYDLRADPLKQYVAGGYFAPLGDYVRTLPEWIDPIQRDFGLDTYTRMVESDPQVGSCIEVYKANVLSDGWRFAPAQDTDEDEPPRLGQPARKKSSPVAQEAFRFARYALETALTATPLPFVLREMLDAMYEGHTVAEKVMRVQEDGPWQGRLVFDRIKVRPPRCCAFVQDAYDNTVGILGLMPNVPFYGLWPSFGFLAGDGLSLLPGSGKNSLQQDAPSLLPRSKFAVITWDGKHGSPQGRSLLRRAFTPWWWKENGYAIWGGLVSKHADPSLVGELPENAMPAPDPSGALASDGVTPLLVSPGQAMANALSLYQNGSYIVPPPGGKVTALQVNNSGEAIGKFMDWCNREIAKAVLGQTLSTEEGKTGTRAQGAVHENTKDDVTRYGRVQATVMVVNDLLRLLMRVNGYPDEVTPEFSLGQEETMTFADFAAGASSLGYAVDDSQFVGMDEMGGLPPRDAVQWAAQMQMKRRQQEQAVKQGELALKAGPPAGPGADRTPN